jgi:hypothetical protein
VTQLVSSELSRAVFLFAYGVTTMADEDPNILLAENDGVNGEEDIENEDDDDDNNSEGDDMDDSGEDNDDEESGNDEDDG